MSHQPPNPSAPEVPYVRPAQHGIYLASLEQITFEKFAQWFMDYFADELLLGWKLHFSAIEDGAEYPIQLFHGENWLWMADPVATCVPSLGTWAVKMSGTAYSGQFETPQVRLTGGAGRLHPAEMVEKVKHDLLRALDRHLGAALDRCENPACAAVGH